MKEIKYNLQKS